MFDETLATKIGGLKMLEILQEFNNHLIIMQSMAVYFSAQFQNRGNFIFILLVNKITLEGIRNPK